MIIKNWKYLINSLLIMLGMIGTFMSATLSYSKLLIESIGIDLFIVVMTLEMISSITTTYFLFLIVIIDFIKDNKKGRE